MALNPTTLLVVSLIVGLMAMGLLVLSAPATSQVRHGLREWVVGDALAAVGRVVLLAQPGVLDAAGVPWLQPQLAGPLNASLVIAGALAHTLSVRAALRERDNPWTLQAAAVGLTVAFLVAAPLLARPEPRVLLMLSCTTSCMAWTIALCWPYRRQYRGAWLTVGIMVVMLGFALSSVPGLLQVPTVRRPPPLLPPLGVLMLSLIASLAATMAFTLIQFERMRQHIERLSTTDTLTGVCNRRGFLQQLSRRWDEARRHGQPLALAILDLDHFKRINDTLGHRAGDAVLVAFVERLRAHARSSDVLGRWGGEEFVLLMPGASQDEARAVTERLRAAVAASPLVPGLPLVTFSGGVTGVLHLAPGLDQEALIHQADERLYRAKQQRNCVVADDSESAAPAVPQAEMLAI